MEYLITRNLALKEYELKEAPDGTLVIFSIKFITKNGERVFIPRAVAAGLRFNSWSNKMRGIQSIDGNNNPTGHITPVHIDSIIEWNGKKVKL